VAEREVLRLAKMKKLRGGRLHLSLEQERKKPKERTFLGLYRQANEKSSEKVPSLSYQVCVSRSGLMDQTLVGERTTAVE
jgi:hypothetical protein